MAGKIQNEDIKSAAELVAAGGTAAQMPNDTKIWLTALGLNKSLSAAIIAGDLAGGSSMALVHTTGTSQALAINTEYLLDNAALVTASLPTTAALGDKIKIRGLGIGGWLITQAAGQYIVRDTATTAVGVSGTLSSSHYRTCIELICVEADLGFQVVNSQGAMTLFMWSFQGATKSYWAGAYGNAAGTSGSIDALTFATDAMATLGGSLFAARDSAATGIASTKGYLLGGSNAGVSSTGIQDFTWATEISANVGATLSTAHAGGAHASQSTKCYMAGGDGPTTLVVGFTYSGAVRANLAATISAAKLYYGDSSMSAPLKGYFNGGFDGGATVYDAIDALLFSADTISTLAAVLSTTLVGMAGTSSLTVGYLSGGQTSNAAAAAITTMQKLTFASEVRATLGSSLTTAVGQFSGNCSTLAGFTAGGQNTAGTYVTVTNKMPFSTETNAVLAAVLHDGAIRNNGLQA